MFPENNLTVKGLTLIQMSDPLFLFFALEIPKGKKKKKKKSRNLIKFKWSGEKKSKKFQLLLHIPYLL